MSARFIKAFGPWLAAVLAVWIAPQVQAQSDYQIRAGDTLRIEVLEDSDLNRNTLVLPDGTISFPLAGSVLARGRTVPQLQQALAAGLASNFAAPPNVFVSVATLAEIKPARTGRTVTPPVLNAFVMGEIAKPGKFEITPDTTLLQLLAEAGGPTKFAADKRIELRRTDPATGVVSTYLFSYSGRAKGQRISGGTLLIPGDVIVVPERRLFE